mgnify:CR=1 FL=1
MNSLLKFKKNTSSPIILSFPHSGRNYKNTFMEQSNVDYFELRDTEDAFLDEIYSKVIEKNFSYIFSDIPRCFIDLNRTRNEMTYDNFLETSKKYLLNETSLAKSGFGVIHTNTNRGNKIYKNKLDLNTYEDRLIKYYDPWYERLSLIINDLKKIHKNVLLIDCHSMPSFSYSLEKKDSFDFVIGDFHGKTCSREIKNFIFRYFEKSNYTFSFNYPYAGQNIIKNFSSLDYGISAIQLEVNKRLYMNEKEVTPYSDNTKIINFLYDFIKQLKDFMASLNENKMAAE